ncbi:MAG: response regulator transcription factor [Paludibacter sp.]|nr:MAG: response regulator transcription factor [Paludibacter sp.]
MKILIADDEIPARNHHRRLLNEYFPELHLCAEASSVEEAWDSIRLFSPDLVLLDVDMPDGSAFDLLRKFPEIPFSIIFITAHEKYALQAIKFSALDFLLKPFTEAEFADAIRKAIRKHGASETVLQLKTLMQNLNPERSEERIVLKTANSIHVVALTEIIRLQADGAYTTFFFQHRKPIVVSHNLKEYDGMLAGKGFVRSHQSHMVNLRQVNSFLKTDGGALALADGSRVPVATRYKERVLDAIARI